MNQNNSDFEVYQPVALTIAGSDSGGGAGIQADLRTFSAFGVFGCSAITALTAQNPFRVAGIQAAEPEIVEAQLNAVFDAFHVDAIKTGMLFSREIIETTAKILKKRAKNIPLVADPVMVSTSGSELLRPDAAEALKRELLPLAAWITPNLAEAEALSGIKICSVGDMEKAAHLCHEKFSCGVIVKGGHFAGENAVDVAFSGEFTYFLTSPRVETEERTTHGTGCTFSSAVAANLAKGLPDRIALEEAKFFVTESLRDNVRTGENVHSMFPPCFRKNPGAF